MLRKSPSGLDLRVQESGVWNTLNDLQTQGIVVKSARYNASEAALLQTSLFNGEGLLSQTGALVVKTGKYTGRSPEDKHIVQEPSTKDDIWWEGNRKMSPTSFECLKSDMLERGGRGFSDQLLRWIA